jgi:aminoglycoside phosphotransferase (APT) family kinase protein
MLDSPAVPRRTDMDLADLGRRITAAAQGWAPGCEVTGLQAMEGGTVGLVYAASLVGGPPAHPTVVVKVAPPGLPPLRNRDVLRQARCIAALDGQPGVAVPPHLFSDAGEPDDIPPFFATGLVAGECAEPLLEAARAPMAAPLVEGRAHAAVRTLAALHRVDPVAAGLGDEPVTSLAGEVARWTRTFETVPDEYRTGYEACAAALEATAPAPLPDRIVHGDYRLGNMLAEGTEVRAVIDWEIWSRSDPRIDLAWLLFFTDEAGHPAAGAGVPSGMPSAAALLARYEEEAGTRVVDLEWFHALTRYKEAAAMALIAKLAVRRGQPEQVASWAPMLTGMVADAHRRVR